MDRFDELINDIKDKVKKDTYVNIVMSANKHTIPLIDRVIMLTMQAMVEKMKKDKEMRK